MSESRTRYFRNGKLIIGAAKLIDLDNYIKVSRGYFTKYIHASTLFFFFLSFFFFFCLFCLFVFFFVLFFFSTRTF